MNKFLEFLQGSSGEMSSKRLGYLSTIPVSLAGTIWICDRLIDSNNAAMAVQVWDSFLIFSAVLGGFVSAELIPTVVASFRGKIASVSKPKKEDQNVENNT